MRAVQSHMIINQKGMRIEYISHVSPYQGRFISPVKYSEHSEVLVWLYKNACESNSEDTVNMALKRDDWRTFKLDHE